MATFPAPILPALPLPPEVTLVLPEPPSANRYWRHARGRTYVSAEAEHYRGTVRAACIRARVRCIPRAHAVALIVAWHRHAMRGDLGNRVKVLEDALQGWAYEDDAQITVGVQTRHEAPRRGRVEVTIIDLGVPCSRSR